jgi:hypothetical protein
MKNPFLSLTAIPVLALCLATGFTAAQAATALDLSETETLQFMREEEKLARDVYPTLYSEWGKTIFANISESEQTHTDAVAFLIDKYDVEDPVADDVTGEFVNPVLQALYDDLLSHGAASLVEALRVGAYIEETDMLDLQHAIDGTDNRDIVNVYENLLRGSRNHLRAFVAALEAMGVVYDAQVLPQEEVDDIVDSPMERG